MEKLVVIIVLVVLAIVLIADITNIQFWKEVCGMRPARWSG